MGVNELRLKPAIHYRSHGLPKAIDIVKTSLSEPRQLVFEDAVVMRSVIAASGRRLGLGESSLVTAPLLNVIIEILVLYTSIPFTKPFDILRMLSPLMKQPPARTKPSNS